MKKVLMSLAAVLYAGSLFAMGGPNQPSGDYVDGADYTCAELTDMVNDNGKLYVKAWLGHVEVISPAVGCEADEWENVQYVNSKDRSFCNAGISCQRIPDGQ